MLLFCESVYSVKFRNLPSSPNVSQVKRNGFKLTVFSVWNKVLSLLIGWRNIIEFSSRESLKILKLKVLQLCYWLFKLILKNTVLYNLLVLCENVFFNVTFKNRLFKVIK